MKLTTLQKTKSTIRFNAPLFQPKTIEKSGISTLLTLPKSAIAKLPSQNMTIIEGVINGLPFQSTLEPDRLGSHSLRINKPMKGALRAEVGDEVSVEITRIADEPETRVPMDLHTALEAAPHALALWTDITPLARRDWIFWLIGAKQKETRKRRVEKACDMLSSGKRRVCCFAGIAWLMKNYQK